MIKKVAKVDNVYHCRICNRKLKNNEQFLSDRLNMSGWKQVSYHVSCIMQLCGQEVEPGMVWKTPDEIEIDKFILTAREKIHKGESLLDA